jgi:hypothetical protein
VRKRYSGTRGDIVREMEAADWASLSDQDLLERRIPKLALRSLINGQLSVKR